LATWRAELMHRVWAALEEQERRDSRPTFTLLRFRADHPELNSQQAAEALSDLRGKPLSAEWVRKGTSLARRRFAALLLDEVARSLADPTAEALESELLELGWHAYCREALRDRRRLGKA